MQKNLSGSTQGLIEEMLSGSVAGNIKFESGGGSSVTITPTLESGTKIADFTIDDVEGSLYAPTPEQPIEYTAGANIQISEENVISATDTKYTAGANIQISENNVISATSGGVNYSTEEQVVGTWIDGKPVYRKVIEFSSTQTFNHSSDKDITSLADFSTLKQPISCEGVYEGSSEEQTTPLSMYKFNNKIFARTYIDIALNKLILEYTKTTD